MTELRAKPLEWTEQKGKPPYDWHEWHDSRLGFYVRKEPDADAEGPYSACFGEDDSEYFDSLDAAKQWCQKQADAFVRSVATVA